MSKCKKIDVVSGEGKELDISPVYEHLNVDRPKKETKHNIVVPKEKKITNNKKED